VPPAFKLRTIIEVNPMALYSFRCPQCDAENPVRFNRKGLVPCDKCGYQFYPQSFEKIYEPLMEKLKQENVGTVINF
jgi:ribosomal protein L37AE/L43A